MSDVSPPVIGGAESRAVTAQVCATFSFREERHMQRLFTWIGLIILAATAFAAGDESADRDKLIGSWQLQDSTAGSPATAWIFSARGDDLEVTQMDGDKVIAKFHCSTQGSSCDIKTDGKKATMSMWYNGAKLVQMESRGSDVVKRRFGVVAPGNAMEMEVIPVVPSGKTEMYHFQRSPTSAQSK